VVRALEKNSNHSMTCISIEGEKNLARMERTPEEIHIDVGEG